MSLRYRLEVLAVAVLELLAAAAGARIITPDGMCRLGWGTASFGLSLCATYLVPALTILRSGTVSRCLLLSYLYLLWRFAVGWGEVELDAHEDASCTAVHLLDHRTEELIGLELVDEQRILVLLASVLYRVTEFIHLT